jgi:hypothetical protein
MAQKVRGKLSILSLLVQLIRCSSANSNLLGLSSQPYGIEVSNDCAVQCKESGYNPGNWSTFSPSDDYFDRCSWKPALFTYDISGQNSSAVIRVCQDSESDEEPGEKPLGALIAPMIRFCAPGPLPHSVLNTEISRRPAKESTKAVPGQVLGAGMVIKDALLRHTVEKTTNGLTIHAHYGNTVMGAFLGSEVDMVEFAHGSLEDFLTAIEMQGTGQTLQYQFCGQNNPGNSSSAFGIIADTSSGNEAFLTVRNVVSVWAQGGCSDSLEPASLKSRIVSSRHPASNGTGPDEQQINKTSSISLEVLQNRNRLASYGPECQTGTVVAEDTCGKLAVRCGVSGDDFMRFNKKPNLCATLIPGQLICCSEGDLPDIRPKMHSNGECAVHNVAPGEWCAMVASKYGLTVNDLESFNKKTWGWSGCDKFMPYTKLCVSKGEPPFPAAQSTAICGPTKPGTRKPRGSKSTDWVKLNECPLKSCCNIWGNCGTTEEFCVDKSTGPPGTSSGPNGCVSNCGLLVTNNKQAPSEFRHVGYFEAWNSNRKCLHMDITDIPGGAYTHIHYAFADIDFNYKVSVAKNQDQFDKFKRAKNAGYKRILAFGGWAFSTEAATADIFRAGVRAGNRERLSSSLVDFIVQNELDGIDFDWEYPGVPDMTWLPPSSADEVIPPV